MRFIRYQDASGKQSYGAITKDEETYRVQGDILSDYQITAELAEVQKLLAPIFPPSILCIGANYRFHIKEVGASTPEYPVLFMKTPAAVQNPEDPIEIPRQLPSEEVDYEGELAVIIGKKCKNVSREKALEYVFGYTCANDVSARDWQIKRGGSQWCRGKTFDTFAPLGPCIVTQDEIVNPNKLRLQTVLNGETVQDWNTDDMLFDVPAIIEFLSASTTLMPGTVILTGTPQGVGMARKPPLWLKPGDTISVEIEKIGKLTNPVIYESL